MPVANTSTPPPAQTPVSSSGSPSTNAADPPPAVTAQGRIGGLVSVDTAEQSGFAVVTGISSGASTVRTSVPKTVDEVDPPPFILEDKSERHINRISEKAGRATLSVMTNAVVEKQKGSDSNGAKLNTGSKTGLIQKYKTADFLVTDIRFGSAETFGVDINNIGFTFNTSGTSPETVEMVGTLLNGRDFTELFPGNGMIVDTDWVNKFIYDYDTKLKASVAVKAGDRIFFNYQDSTYEVYLIGLNTVNNSESPMGVSFALRMLVKRKWIAPKTIAAIQAIERRQQPFFLEGDKAGKRFRKILLPADYKLVNGRLFVPQGSSQNILSSIRNFFSRK